MTTRHAFLSAALLVATLHPAVSAAAGMTTHAFMADIGRQSLPEGRLKQILTVYRPSLIAGAIFPDGGYGSGVAFPKDRDMAEHSHWGGYHLAFTHYLRERGCAAQAATQLIPSPLPGGVVNNPVGTLDLAGISEECGRLIAFAFGIAAHGVTDETWDAQFEPEVRHRGEDPNFAHWFGAEGFWGPIAPESPLRQILGGQYNTLAAIWAQTPMNAIEYTMDVIAIVEHKLQPNSPLLVFPPADHLIAVYERSGLRGITREQIERGSAVTRAFVQLQAATAHLDYFRVRSHMPWSANNYFLSAGGVISSGRVVTAMYQNMWERLLAAPQTPLTPKIAGHYPEHGQTGVQLQPAQGRGWTQHRWIHVFMDAEIDPAAIETPGAFALYDEGGHRVPVTVQGGHGWSRHGSHSTRIRLDGPLKAGHRYTAILTPKVKDGLDRPLARPYVWEFVTAAETAAE